MYWITTADGHHCTRHEVKFRRGEVCRPCVADPGPQIGAGPGVVGDRDALVVEGDLLQTAKETRRLAKKLSAGTTAEKHCGAKYYDVYLKALRLWSETREPRLAREHDRSLLEHEREMSGLRGSN